MDWFSAADPPRALEVLAQRRQSELWESTLSFLERGKAEDALGNHAAAAILISEGLTGLDLLREVSKREDIMASYEEIVDQYTARLNELRHLAALPVAMGLPVGIEGINVASTPPTASPRAASDASSSAPAPAPSDSSSAPLAQGKMCLELAMSADESGYHDEDVRPASLQCWPCPCPCLCHAHGMPASMPRAAQTIALYTAAAEHYFDALKLEDDEAKQLKHRATVTMMLERAEQLKHGKPSAASPPAPPSAAAAPAAAAPAAAAPAATPPAAPKPTQGGGQRLADDEKDVLARSSKVAGKLFYPYMNDGQRERFHFDGAWDDPDGLLALSEKQKVHFGGWARPSQFVQGEPRMIYLVSSLSITQTIITDCSFVSSLVIAAAYERRHGKQLITNIIFPQDRAGMPIYNPAGKYLVKLHVNGIARKVLVDDRLPLSKDGRLMTSHTTHAQELWVSIIEKAYMKLNGGYDFPGSNSGIDMFALTGWIPEQFNTEDRSGAFDAARLWDRMQSASKFGDCLLTVATGELKELHGEVKPCPTLTRPHLLAHTHRPHHLPS